MRDAILDAWVEKARSVKIEDEIARRRIKLTGNGKERCGPCPFCGGEDRFSINTTKQVFNCRRCSARGDVIDLTRHLDGCDFMRACETLTGAPRPKGNGNNRAAKPKKVVAAEFSYEDASGEVVLVVERVEYQNADGTYLETKEGKRRKTFWQKRPDPDKPGQWIYNVDGVPVLPYRLPELIEAVANEQTTVVVEGELKVDLLRSWNVPATCCAGGAKKWEPEHSQFLSGANVVILPDADRPGREHADLVAASLQDVAASVRVLDLPGLAEKGDVIDWATAGGTVEKLHALIERSVEADRMTNGGEREENTPASRKTIRIVKGQIARMTDEAEAALIAAADVAPILVRAGLLVQPVVDQLPAARGRMTDITLLRRLSAANLVYLLNKHAATFERYDMRDKDWVAVDPPAAVAVQLLEKGQWRFPKVAGVITTPTLRPDGTILDRPGYDPATQLWYAPDSHLAMPPLVENPTREQAEQALDLLDGLLANFPFEAAVDRAVALAAMLTAVLRGAFDVTPMSLFRAPDIGTGKSVLADLISTIARGQPCPVITASKSVEEMEKRLGALVLEGVPMISLDNCSENIGGDLLCQITERRLIRIRILGKSEAPECEWRGMLFGTGNNVTLLGDMTRRGLVANLDAKLERPEMREL